MAKLRFIGKGAVIKVNDNGDGSTFTTLTIARNLTQPPQVKAKIDTTGMEDTTAQIVTGIEEEGEFTFLMIHDPSDAGDTAVQTLYTSGDSVEWNVLTKSGTTVDTRDFTGKVISLVPQSMGGADPQVWQVTVTRDGAIGDTVA